MASYRHYVSDVVFGIGIGLAAGRATTFHHRDAQITLIPSLSQDAASINVTVVKESRHERANPSGAAANVRSELRDDQTMTRDSE